MYEEWSVSGRMGCFHVTKKGRVTSGGLVDSVDKDSPWRAPNSCARTLQVTHYGSEPVRQAAALHRLPIPTWSRLEQWPCTARSLERWPLAYGCTVIPKEHSLGFWSLEVGWPPLDVCECVFWAVMLLAEKTVRRYQATWASVGVPSALVSEKQRKRERETVWRMSVKTEVEWLCTPGWWRIS